ncbi:MULTISPECIES: hypothetical protein [unclassified Marinovum]
MTEVVAELSASPARRVIGVGTMFALGALVLYLALSESYDNPLWQVLLIAIAAVALYAATRMYQATALRLQLRDDGLYDSEGHLLAAYDDVETVERGMLAMKPSNGFMIILKKKRPGRWRPGLYWIKGKRIGVGGVTAASHAKFMADMMNMKMSGQLDDL